MSNTKNPYSYDPIQKKLTVRQSQSFPQEIFEHADEVEILDMSFGQLKTLPEDFGRFKKLRVAFFSHNDFTQIPPVLATCHTLALVGFKSCKIRTLPNHSLPPGLRGIILTDNQISKLPASIDEYTKLKKLMLAGNHLRNLPEEIMNCQNLELIRLSVNTLQTSPDWLFKLPKLGWYADASNPFHDSENVLLNEFKEIDWKDIILGEKIGESASNTVYEAELPDGTEIAVKLYGSSLSTDGMADDDMQACLLAGSHNNIIGGIGKLVNTPDNQPGLVMPLISGEFIKLGNPPDFKTFTRDIYPQEKVFSLPFINRVLKNIASAMKHCHAKGIMHGDIYAHNILSNAEGKSYLGDFGAASLYEPNSKEGKLRELVDVRGFGCLVEELLSHCTTTADDSARKNLRSLMKSCLETDLVSRPTFEEICDLLK